MFAHARLQSAIAFEHCQKNEVNFKRQESGYTQKDGHDSKHI